MERQPQCTGLTVRFLHHYFFKGAMCFLGSSCAAAVYYLDTESSSRKLWLLGSGVFITIWPYTALVMLPDIYKNLKDDVLETRGELLNCMQIYIIYNQRDNVISTISCTPGRFHSYLVHIVFMSVTSAMRHQFTYKSDANESVIECD